MIDLGLVPVTSPRSNFRLPGSEVRHLEEEKSEIVDSSDPGQFFHSMQKRRLGSSELELTTIGIGTWAIGGGDWAFGWGDQDEREAIVGIRKGVELGVNWIDTAAIYGDGASEVLVGKALREIPESERPLVATKCGRIMREDGTVKVLDFGLAKAVTPEASGVSPTESPTMSLTAATQMGMVLGTAAYMAPEQARGKVVDKRADVWAFGVVLYEMLTGQRAFVGEDTSLTLAAVMTTNPDMDRLPTALPTAVRKCLERCFQKEPRARVRDIGDVQLAMEGAFETTVLAPPNEARATQSLWQRPGAWLVVSLIVVVGLAGLLVLQSPPTSGSRVVRFVESTEGRMTFPREGRAVAISPDGNLLVYAAKNELFLRELGSAVATQIPGSNDGTAPFFSPDGEWIGFFTTRQLKKVAVSGGEPFVVCDVPRGLSGTWGVDDTIVFSRHGLTGLVFVSTSIHISAVQI